MIRAFYPLVALSLALLIGLTGYEAAVARGTAAPVGQMVICTGQGLMTVAVDAEGQPIGPVHVCPDAVLGFFAATSAAAVEPRRIIVWRSVSFDVDPGVVSGCCDPHAKARAPPAFV